MKSLLTRLRFFAICLIRRDLARACKAEWQAGYKAGQKAGYKQAKEQSPTQP